MAFKANIRFYQCDQIDKEKTGVFRVLQQPHTECANIARNILFDDEA